ncbi:LysR family transcriptional regulator [Herbaspirillum sp. NPDC087042]|uniref:LysR family transcriptional regulator n=1 Tax=Herbaspirillum sp. NPDC087042 TaxID=3364004 RepID=UPI003810D98B
MTLKQLEAFYWAATLGSFSIASTRLNITQSTLSKRLAELETSLGVSLFDRSAQRSVLTEHGQHILDHAHRILVMEGELKALLDMPQPLSGTCRFGVSELTALTWFPKFVSRINAEHPLLVLEPYIDLASALEKKLLRGELDFAILPRTASDTTQLSAIPLATLEFAWMSSPRRIAAGKVLSKKDIQLHPVITMTSESRLTESFHLWAAQHGVPARRVLACNSLSAIVGLTIADVGISFLPRHFLQPMVDQHKLNAFQCDPPLPSIEYCLRWRSDDTRALVPSLASLAQQEVDYTLTYGF